AAYPWRAGDEHQDRSRYDFSGKTDPQIVRDLVESHVGKEPFESGLPRALELYLEELARQLAPAPEAVVPKPGIPQPLARPAEEPKVTLAPPTRNPSPRASLKPPPPRFNRH